MAEDPKPPRGFWRFRREAETLAKDPANLTKKIDEARKKLDAKSSSLGEIKSDTMRLFRMLKCYGRGDYRQIPWKTLVTGVAGALYLVNPLDVIPDFLLGIGLIDDATVLAFCLAALKGDLDAFKEWEKNHADDDVDPKPV